jgi:hypothetical protein
MLEALEASRKTRIPLYIVGPPGCAKSAVVNQYTEGIEYNILKLDPPKTWDPIDARGIPAGVNGRTVWLPPDYMDTADKPTVIFIDEIGILPPTSQAFLNGLLYGRELGGHPIPESAMVVAAGNRVSDGAAVNRMPSHTATRIVHLLMTVDLDDVTKWWLENGVATPIIAYHRFTGGSKLYPMYNSDLSPMTCGLCGKTKLEAGELCSHCLRAQPTFPNLRTWHYASDMLQQNLSPAIELDVLSGCIGQPSALELKGYLDLYRALPSLDVVLMAPRTAPVPENMAALYAIATALGRRATDTNMDAVVQYIDRLPPEFAVLCMKDTGSRDKSLLDTRAAMSWMARNNDVMF